VSPTHGGLGGVVGAVTVGHDVDVGNNLGKHALHHPALTGGDLSAHQSARGGGTSSGAVTRAVVIDVHHAPR
jgi:hypothetical protein